MNDQEHLMQSLAEGDAEINHLQSKLTEMESVLKWASENVRDLSNFRWIMSGDVNWSLTTKDYQSFTEPNLYEALWSAWKASQPTNKDVM